MSVKLAVQTVFTALDHMSGPMTGMNKGVSRFAQNANRAGLGIGASLGRLRGIISTVAAAVAGGAAVKAITNFADKGDEIARMANILGLSTTAMQQFNYAAKMSDITSEELATAFKKMNNNMGQLKTGTGTLYTFLKATNPQLALQLKHTNNSEEAFSMLSDAIAKETDVSKRAALTQAAFGRSGQGIIEMTTRLNELKREAQERGAVISPEDILAAQLFHENLKQLTIMGQGFINKVLARAISVIGPWLDKLNKWVFANRELIGQKIDAAINAVGRAFEYVAPFLKAAVDMFNLLKPLLPFIVAGIVGLTVAQWALNVAMDANPVGAVILSLTALVAIVIVVIRYWKEITAALTTGWNTLNQIFNNPAVRIALQMIAAPLAIILSIIQTIVDLVQGKGWKSLWNLGGPLKGITDALGITKGGGQIPVSPNTNTVAAASGGNGYWQGRLDIAGAPAGSTFSGKGSAPITVGMFNTLRDR